MNDYDKKFLDKYEPIIDLSDKRYTKKVVTECGYYFVYDKQDALIIWIGQDKDEKKVLGRNCPWRELDSQGLSYDNWKESPEYWAEVYADEIRENAYYLEQDFKNEIEDEIYRPTGGDAIEDKTQDDMEEFPNANGTLEEWDPQDLMNKVAESGYSMNTSRTHNHIEYTIFISYDEYFGLPGKNNPDEKYEVDIISETPEGKQDRIVKWDDWKELTAKEVVDKLNNWKADILAGKEPEYSENKESEIKESTDSEIKYISEKEADKIYDNEVNGKYPTMTGKFIIMEPTLNGKTVKNKVVAIDNSTEDAWTEEFNSEEEAIKWLKDELEIKESIEPASDDRFLRVYVCEVGVLLPEDHHEYNSYNTCYDHKYAFYDENVIEFLSFEEAKKYGIQYTKKGVKKTYCVVSYDDISLKDIDEIEKAKQEIVDYGTSDYIDLFNGDYLSSDSVLYSCYKDENGNIVENFVNTDDKIKEGYTKVDNKEGYWVVRKYNKESDNYIEAIRTAYEPEANAVLEKNPDYEKVFIIAGSSGDDEAKNKCMNSSIDKCTKLTEFKSNNINIRDCLDTFYNKYKDTLDADEIDYGTAISIRYNDRPYSVYFEPSYADETAVTISVIDDLTDEEIGETDIWHLDNINDELLRDLGIGI